MEKTKIIYGNGKEDFLNVLTIEDMLNILDNHKDYKYIFIFNHVGTMLANGNKDILRKILKDEFIKTNIIVCSFFNNECYFTINF